MLESKKRWLIGLVLCLVALAMMTECSPAEVAGGYAEVGL